MRILKRSIRDSKNNNLLFNNCLQRAVNKLRQLQMKSQNNDDVHVKLHVKFASARLYRISCASLLPLGRLHLYFFICAVIATRLSDNRSLRLPAPGRAGHSLDEPQVISLSQETITISRSSGMFPSLVKPRLHKVSSSWHISCRLFNRASSLSMFMKLCNLSMMVLQITIIDNFAKTL